MDIVLHEHDIALVRNSWRAFVYAQLGLGVKLHYQRLFTLAPELQAFFPADMSAQHKALGEMLLELVSLLKTPDLAKKLLAESGLRHQQRGIKAEHYPFFIEALLYALQQVLAEEYSPEIEQAWRKTLQWAAQQMLAAYK